MSSHSIFPAISSNSIPRFAAYASLFILAAYFVNLGFVQPLPRVNVETSQYLAETLNTKPVTLTKSEILSWGLFGPASPPSQETKETIKKSSLKFKVNGIILDSKDRTGWTILSKDGSEEKLYTVGDKITSEIEIARIDPNMVVINNAGTFESLHLADFEGSLSIKRSLKEKSELSNKQNDKKDKIDPNASKRERLLKYFSLSPVEPGADLGYRVSEESKKLINDYDLKPGDIILSANGYPLGTESADMAALQVFNNIGKAEITISRNGSNISRSYPN